MVKIDVNLKQLYDLRIQTIIAEKEFIKKLQEQEKEDLVKLIQKISQDEVGFKEDEDLGEEEQEDDSDSLYD